MKQQYQHAIAHIEKLAPVWQDRMGLSHVQIEHVFLDAFDGEGSNDDYKTTAVTESRWQYMQAKVKWYLPSMIRHSDEALEGTLVHELCHVLLGAEQVLVFEKAVDAAEGMADSDADALMDRYSEQLELSTELTARAILRGWREPK